MGINGVVSSGLQDYLEYVTSEEQSILNSAFQVTLGVDKELEGGKFVGLDFSYELNSFNAPGVVNQYTLEYSLYSPSIMYGWQSTGKGYKLRFGVGAGPRFITFTESGFGSNLKVQYNSIGYGFLVKAEAATAIASNVYAVIAGDLRFNSLGTIKESQSISPAWAGFQTSAVPALTYTTYSPGLTIGILVTL